ncbi:MAG: hypothetical protein KC466_16405 [Myxococcales bacterium]|nr:hypothetical protein [Myxococcales bacterium]
MPDHPARKPGAWILAALLAIASASPGLAAGEGGFSAEARAPIKAGNIAGARDAAIDLALNQIFADALQQAVAGAGASAGIDEIFRAFAARRDEFISRYSIRTEIPTDAEYLVALDGSVNVESLRGALRSAGYIAPRSTANPASPGDLMEVTIEGVRDFHELEEVGAMLARDVPGARGSTLDSVKGTVVRFRLRYAGTQNGLAMALNRHPLGERTLALRGVSATGIALTIADGPAARVGR